MSSELTWLVHFFQKRLDLLVESQKQIMKKYAVLHSKNHGYLQQLD
jgi:hypothetical protein